MKGIVSHFRGRAFGAWLVALVLGGLALLLPALTGNAAAPVAGTVIGNQASATYTDASSIPRTATSNTVTSIVQQVASLTLTASQSRTVAPGGTIYFPHTVTNTGNGSDTIALTATDADTGIITFSNLVMYADADGNGVPDNAIEITGTGPLASGAVFRFVVAAVVPGTATNGQSEAITVTATSGFTPAVSAAPNTDTVNVSGNAVIAVTKALSISSGPSPSSGQVTVTLTYTNTGNSAASNVTITDIIGTGATAGMTYVAASGGWSGGATVTDAVGGDSSGLDYSWNTGTNTVTAIIASVPPVTSGTITFRVTINSGLPPGFATTQNTASYIYNDGVNPVGPVNTNTATYTVLQSAGVVANGSNASSADGTAEPVVTGPATQGATVSFTDYIWNTGNGTDSFDITLASSNFPSGTTFQLYRSDGVTPLTDSNGNGIPDTGPLAAGANYLVVLKATLPATAASGSYSVTLTAASFFDGAVSNPVIDTLSGITASTVDLTNNNALGAGGCTALVGNTCGGGAGPEGAAVVNNSVNPGASTTFTLYANNTSSVADSYDLMVDDDGAFGAVIDIPAGWSVVFNADGGAGNCSTLGAVITNTGVVNAGAARAVCATLAVPAGYPAGAQQIYFRILSPTTGALDVKHDSVTVNTVRSVSLTPNNSGQIYPGGSIVFSHTIANAGNVLEGNGTVSTIVLANSDSFPGWNSVVYYDLNNNGALDVSDPIVPGGGLHLTVGAAALADGLGIAESARIFVKVFAPAGAAIGDINTSSLIATTSNGSYATPVPAAVTAQDTTQVIAGQVRMEKTQALDAACDGTPDTAYSNATITGGAVPGACIRYQVVAANDGTAPISLLVISDSTPPNTTYDDGSRDAAGGVCGTGPVDAGAATTVGAITAAPACNVGGTIQATVGGLNPGQSVTVTFGVMINY